MVTPLQIYEGQAKWVDGVVPDGIGKLIKVGASEYVGQFKDCKRHGKGIITTNNVHKKAIFVDDEVADAYDGDIDFIYN